MNTDAAKRVLIYLDLEITERRLNKIMAIFDEYKAKEIEEAKEAIKAIYEVHGQMVSQLDVIEMYIPVDHSGYKPIISGRVNEMMRHAAEFVCERHGITMEQLKADSPDKAYSKSTSRPGRKLGKKSRAYVNARTDFAKILRAYYHRRITLRMITSFMGYSHHSSVIHLYKDRKEYDEIPEAV